MLEGHNTDFFADCSVPTLLHDREHFSACQVDWWVLEELQTMMPVAPIAAVVTYKMDWIHQYRRKILMRIAQRRRACKIQELCKETTKFSTDW
jgi:hypothetical protein